MARYAIVLAGGSGQRMGAEGNKVFLPLRGIPALVRALVPFSALCQGVVVVARPQDREEMAALIKAYGLTRLVAALVAGGQDRQASVAAGLAALPEEADMVLVHDGARALVTEEVIRRVMDSVEAHGSGIAAIPVTDTIKRADPAGQVQETLDRQTLYAMQTPQGFQRSLLEKAHAQAEKTGFRGTDDAAVLEHAGMPVFLCRGDAENIKLTTPMDVMLAERILEKRQSREASS